jgi:hypothetical protein
MFKFEPFTQFTQTSIANWQRRVRMQENALAQAEADLRAAQAREGIEPEPLDDEQPSFDPPRSIYVSELARQMHAAAERRRRGLGPEEQAYDPVRQAQMIVDADQKARKARGEK